MFKEQLKLPESLLLGQIIASLREVVQNDFLHMLEVGVPVLHHQTEVGVEESRHQRQGLGGLEGLEILFALSYYGKNTANQWTLQTLLREGQNLEVFVFHQEGLFVRPVDVKESLEEVLVCRDILLLFLHRLQELGLDLDEFFHERLLFDEVVLEHLNIVEVADLLVQTGVLELFVGLRDNFVHLEKVLLFLSLSHCLLQLLILVDKLLHFGDLFILQKRLVGGEILGPLFERGERGLVGTQVNEEVLQGVAKGDEGKVTKEIVQGELDVNSSLQVLPQSVHERNKELVLNQLLQTVEKILV